ncbi:MAG: GFA family protein [Gammaproteobacteria bacterium]|nr:GFA family protein [Gammaproteobacteria bacterium]MDH3806832.1 GFA family protein [Gammaproteobacteria bacterium]
MSKLNLSGSCLCGSVAYEITGTSRAFFHCHCSRCRKATGTGHASNIIMQPDSVTWTAGEDLLNSYKVPEAKRFMTTFCSNCGSLMPRVAADKSIAVIPAGTLDNDPGICPQARIMSGSRAEWSCDMSELPEFDTYPPAAE